MLLAFASTMNRKPIAFAIVLILAGLAPAMAIIGFCARMPCCSHAPSAHVSALTSGGADCCTTITCYESPSAKLASPVSVADVVFAAPALVPATPVLTSVDRPFLVAIIDTSPPASARVATRSILRI